jgi:transposase-like protein
LIGFGLSTRSQRILLVRNGLLKQLTKAFIERAMNAELAEHLGYDKHDPKGYRSGNLR